jgi:V8-like Glu-specific endopeptidase
VIKEGGALTSGTKIKKMTILRAAHAIFIFHNNIVYSQHLLFVDGSNG